uniref:Peptidyl-prolyl cis-trans isomerase n=1 Tax=Aplanochytrium stocchinoi TaxID=215587 RepID=A0A6S8EPJ9_9STRA|mmetsp:Transcript_9459/g.11771  ORF Transcript_9459/g.11771 Transcript_9459/m.11771 type:complete len:121 (-) Transcript_9459:779-1141(-)|eukprot:CAMPEP_0204859548 /NCGR_PEP_ID=MMETSP1347-20130617/23763_1 /ASSEMBLY_ACC=CAM_ASM_000690 /TAXON_ID=215587 /ORGANISM="Aplanochytrium stocchinoi, Strain GSBS06" /LENGTH=120 /DNA_ID=CAMNT_0052008045 /DNA_START=592 /DNA_END=954 /DNA_ORIENTATION=-
MAKVTLKFLLAALAVFALGLVAVSGASARASASHILVPTEEKAKELLKELDSGADFAELAMEHSTCPSGKKGGALGSFGPGQMVKEFNDVVFGEEYDVNQVHGPVKTQFGYHLILITDRS